MQRGCQHLRIGHTNFYPIQPLWGTARPIVVVQWSPPVNHWHYGTGVYEIRLATCEKHVATSLERLMLLTDIPPQAPPTSIEKR